VQKSKRDRGNLAIRVYNKVLFIANGISIATYLLSIRRLLITYNKQTAYIRHLSLIWFFIGILITSKLANLSIY